MNAGHMQILLVISNSREMFLLDKLYPQGCQRFYRERKCKQIRFMSDY